MIQTAPSLADPNRDDRTADRRTFAIAVVFLGVSAAVNVLSLRTEIGRGQVQEVLGRVAIYEISSALAFIALLPLFAWFASRGTPGRLPLPRLLAVHLLGSVVISLGHIGLMVLIRKAAVAAIYGGVYRFTDSPLREFFYEYRKDVLTYILITSAIIYGRELVHQARELAAAREEARTTARLAFKSGGRTLWVDADQVRWAKAAGNYVEIAAGGTVHLARATLSGVEQQLKDAGADVLRVHRSHLINRAFLQETIPTPSGDVTLVMQGGERLPGSRRFRDRLGVSP